MNLAASPPSSAAASAQLSFSPSAVKVGVGSTGSPYWLSDSLASPYTGIDLGGVEDGGNPAYWPPDLTTNRWFLGVANPSSSTGSIDHFALYNPEAERVYRSAAPPVSIGQYSTVYAKIPFKDTASFSDVSTGHSAWQEVEAIKEFGVTTGCGGGNYCPSDVVNRGAMAVFVARSYAGDPNLGSYAPPATATFSDVPTDHPYFKFIEYCHSRGIVNGYGDDTYRPTVSVTRWMLAIYIARAIGGWEILSPPASPTYSDVDTDHDAYHHIEYLSSSMNASGGPVVGGYGDGTYRPTWTVNRGQMAIFLTRAFVIPR